MVFARFGRCHARTLLAIAAAVLWVPGAVAAAPGKIAVAAFALWSGQGVFPSEAGQAARIAASRLGEAAAVRVLANTRASFAAGPDGIARALLAVGRGLDPDRDVLVVILSSHGSPDGIAERGGRREGLLSPGALAGVLRRSPVRQKVLIVSACYAGIFTGLADPDTLVITAADATHPSFGCEAGATWTYFGDAFFNHALRRATPGRAALDRVFADAAAEVRTRELAQGFEPSNPQLAGGAHVLATLAGAP